MNGPEELRRTLEEVAGGSLSVEAALAGLHGVGKLGFARVDHQRSDRCGFPEVVLCEGKEPDEVAKIAAAILEQSPRCLLTRANADCAAAVSRRVPDAVHHQRARCLTVDRQPRSPQGLVCLVAAGTGDLPVAEEARITMEIMGARVECHVDVGIAGLHRLLETVPSLRRANAVVAVAGMEGALPSVVAGLIDRPVLAVPTSVGYGVSFSGLAPLLAMLNSCAAGVGVVNIDNGFGAGYLAALINRLAAPNPDSRP